MRARIDFVVAAEVHGPIRSERALSHRRKRGSRCRRRRRAADGKATSASRTFRGPGRCAWASGPLTTLPCHDRRRRPGPCISGAVRARGYLNDAEAIFRTDRISQHPRTEESKSAAARSPQVARVGERAAGHPRSPRRCFPFATFPLPARITTFPAADPGQCPTAAYRISDRESGGGLGIRRVPARRWTRLLLDSRSTSVAVRIRERRPRDTASIHDHQRERLCSFSTNEMRAVTGAERRGVVLIRLMCFLNALRP